MSTRDLVLISTFVNALLLGALLFFSQREEELIIKPLPKMEVKEWPQTQPQIVLVKETVVEPEPFIPPPEPLPPQEEWYTIKSGDNPWKVAKTQKIKFEELLKINGLNEERARNLKPGDRIRIR